MKRSVRSKRQVLVGLGALYPCYLRFWLRLAGYKAEVDAIGRNGRLPEFKGVPIEISSKLCSTLNPKFQTWLTECHSLVQTVRARLLG